MAQEVAKRPDFPTPGQKQEAGTARGEPDRKQTPRMLIWVLRGKV